MATTNTQRILAICKDTLSAEQFADVQKACSEIDSDFQVSQKAIQTLQEELEKATSLVPEESKKVQFEFKGKSYEVAVKSVRIEETIFTDSEIESYIGKDQKKLDFLLSCHVIKQLED